MCTPNKDTDTAAQPFSNEDEHGKAIDQIIAMMKKGNGDIQTLKQPEILTNGNILFFNNNHTFQNNVQYRKLTIFHGQTSPLQHVKPTKTWMQQNNHSAMIMMSTVRLSISYIYIFLWNTKQYNQICCAGNDQVIFEHDTVEDEYMFSGQGMLNTI